MTAKETGVFSEVRGKLEDVLAELSREDLAGELRDLAPGWRYASGASVAALVALGSRGPDGSPLLEVEVPLDAAVRASREDLTQLLRGPMRPRVPRDRATSPAGRPPVEALVPGLWRLEDPGTWELLFFNTIPDEADIKELDDAVRDRRSHALISQHVGVYRFLEQ